MPNTSPVADTPSTITWIKDRARDTASVNVLPTSAISKNLDGEELAPVASVVQSGVVAITDDGKCVQNHELMRRAVEYARMAICKISHRFFSPPEKPSLTAREVNERSISSKSIFS